MTTNSKEYARKYYQEHKEKFREAARVYQERKKLEKNLKVSNPRLFDMREDYKAEIREKFQEIRQKELTYSQRYYAENKERIKAQQKEARRKKKINEKQRAYYAANKEHIRELQKKNRLAKKRKERLSKSFLGRIYLKIFG